MNILVLSLLCIGEFDGLIWAAGNTKSQPAVHVLSGKAIAQAVCAHFIIDVFPNTLIVRSVINAPLPCQPKTPESNHDNGP